MRKFTLSILLFITVGIIYAQNVQFDWTKGEGGTGNDWGKSITTDALGNIYTIGSFKNTVDFDPGSGTYNLTSAGTYDIFIQKLDSAGNFIWAKRMGGTGSDYGYSITTDALGNIYTTGYFRGTADFDPGSGTYNLISAGGYDIFIQKLDAAGNFIWAKAMGGTGQNMGISITTDALGNIYTTGYFHGTADFDPGSGTYNLTSAGGADIFIQKLNSAGNFVWAKSMGGAYWDEGKSITTDASGNIYTTGGFQLTVDFDPGSGTYNLISAANSNDIFIQKLDSAGNFIWAKRMGGTGSDYVYSITSDASGYIYTSGYFQGTVDFDPGSGTYNLTSAGSYDIFIQKLDAAGNFIWAKAMGGAGDDRGYSITTDALGNIYSTGLFSNTAVFDPGSGTYNLISAGGYDIFIQKLNSAGNFVWAKAMGGVGNDKGKSITTDASGNIYTTGGFQLTVDFDPGSGTYNLTSAGAYDIFIQKLSQNICVSNNSSLNIASCESYTWPATGQTYTSSGAYTDTLTNIGGCDSIITLNLTIKSKPTITITQPTSVCQGANNIQLSATPSGGTFSGSGVSSSSFSPTAVSAGNHQVYYSYTDTNSCSNTDSITITVNPNPVVNAGTDQSTYNGGNVTLSSSVTGSSGPFTYAWSPSNLVTNAGAASTTTVGLSNTTIFTLSVTDNNTSCSDTDTMEVSVSGSALSSTTSSDKSTICANELVVLTASASGGSGTYSYLWSNASTLASITVSPTVSSTYFVTVNDGSNSVIDSVSITVNPNPVVNAGTDQSTFNGGSVTLSSSVTGSSGPFTYAWSPSNSVTNAGTASTTTVGLSNTTTFTISVTDNTTTCSGSDNVQVNITGSPLSLTANSSKTTLCVGESVNLSAIANGGSGNYTYLWSSNPSGTTSSLASFTANPNNSTTYYVTVSDGSTSLSDSISIVISSNPTASITSTLNSAYCTDASNITLTASPTGGTFSGTGVSGSTFSPVTAGAGSHTITYSYTDGNGCSGSDSLSVQINALPSVSITTSISGVQCSDVSPINLAATPTGGSFSGIGVSNGKFYPSLANTGNTSIIYNYTDGNGCSNSDTLTATTASAPSVNITSSLSTAYCAGAQSVSLSASPTGGTFSGNGVTGNSFNPGTAGAGSHTITYSYTDGNGCNGSDSLSVQINALPSVSFGTLTDVCADVQQVNLTSASPNGGSYFGNAVSSQGIFYPQIAGSGTFILSYSYTDTNGCSDTAISSIKVKSLPNSSFNVAATACLNSNVNINFTGTASAAATYNWNFDNAAISSGSGAGPYGLSWNTAGLKQLSLSVVDSGCTSSLSNNYINILSSFAMITAVGSTSACYGDSVVLFANTGIGYSYQWYDTSGILFGDTLSYFSANQNNSYFCEVTPANSCAAFSDTIAVVIKPQILADFTLATSACKGDIVAVTFNGVAPTGSVYNWNFDSGTIASGSSVGPYNIIWNIDSIQTVGLTITEGACSSDLMEKSINIISTPAMITALGNTSFCDGDNVSLSANAGPYSYEWFKNGLSTSSSQAIFVASSAGNYQVEVTDVNNSCSNISDSVTVEVNTTDFNLAFSASTTNFTIPPFNTTFSNQTASANDYYWMWSFGDGNSSTFINPSHQYGYDGTYTVGVIAQNIASGCFDTLVKTDYITCNGGSANPCTLDPSFGDIGGHYVCPGDSVKLFANDHSTGVSYQWLRDGILIAGASDSIYYASATGLYQLMLTDGSCSVFSNPFSLSLRTTITPVILSNGNIQPCSNDSMELYVSTSFNAYQWSNGANSASIYVNNSGSFIVTITDNNGCQSSSLPYVVNASLLQVPNICIVGIDTTTNHNRVVWERQNSAMIDSFKIYRESSVAGVYNLIGSQPFSTLSVFEDVNSNPAQMAYRYRITAVDTCGMETAPSPIHKTLHLTINAGLGGVWNLIWTNYEGFNFGSYRIYRGSDSTSMQLLTQIQSTLTSYTDLNPPTGNVYYQIEIIAPHQCFPDSIYSKANNNYNNSRSNVANTNLAPNTGFVQSKDLQLSMMLYPNPNKGNFTLEINSSSNKTQDYQMEVYSVMGKLIHQEKLSGKAIIRKQMHFETLSKGVYFVRLRSEDHVINTRFVVE
jgi:uncharacterized membrane protein YqhA